MKQHGKGRPDLRKASPIRGLFPRIFLWFWVTLILIFTGTTAWTLIAESGPWFSVWRNTAQEGLRAVGQNALNAYLDHGKEGLADYLVSLEREPPAQFRIYREDGKELGARAPLPDAQGIVKQALATSRLVFKIGWDRILTGLRITGPDGRGFVIVRRSANGIAGILFSKGFPSFVAKLLFVGIILSLLSYLLTRYITRPIVALQRTVNRFTGGDFSARARDLIGNRKDEIFRLGQDFDRMAEQIQSLMAARERLLRDISHELRSPLARLCIALDLIKKGENIREGKYIRQIEKELERMNQLSDQLLDVVLLREGDVAESFAPVDLTGVVRKIISDAELEAGSKGCRISSSLEEGVYVRGDPEILLRAVENVVRNAIFHTREHTRVRISLKREEAEGRTLAVIEVIDQGPGVPEAYLEEIFRPFFRLSASREPGSGRTGLGLSIARRAVRVHGGDMEALNDPEGGLSIRMELPADGVREPNRFREAGAG